MKASTESTEMNQNVNQHSPQVQDSFVRLSVQLLAALDALQQLKENEPHVAENVAIQQIDDALCQAFIRAREHQDFAAALADLNARLLRQQQSAKEAFAAGWEARLIDILAHLSNEECAALRRVLEALDDQNLPY